MSIITEQEKFEFSRDGGTTWLNLNNLGTFLDASATVTLQKVGWGYPRTRHLSTRSPGQHGVTILDTIYDSRTINIGVYMRSLSRDTYYAYRRAFALLISHLAGYEGKLRYTFPDGTIRQIDCRFVGGFNLSSADETHLGLASKESLRFFCPNPFFYDPAERSTEAKIDVSTAPTYPTVYPRIYVGGDIFATIAVSNVGHVITEPVITITGPGVNPSITNQTTDKTFALARTLATGEVVTVDMRFGKKSVSLYDGVSTTNIFHTASGDFWDLEVGNNNIFISMTGTDANSIVEVAHFDRFLVA